MREKERERNIDVSEKHSSVLPTPRRVSQEGIKLATFQFTGQHSIP